MMVRFRKSSAIFYVFIILIVQKLSGLWISGFIIGGKDAKTDEFKSFISLRDPLNRPVGGGVILSPNWILTVRHELWKSKSDGKFQPNQDVTIFPMYSNNYADYRGKKFYNISQLYCHSWPDDEPQSYSDLGLIKLYENIPIGDQNGFKAIRIADQEDLQSQSNVQFKVAGWGREYRGPFRFDRPLLSKTLKTITINLEPDNMCSDTLDEYKTPNFFCAGSHNQTICFADSGAPAITTSAITGEEIVAGLASFGTPNCWGAATYINLSYFKPWIEYVMETEDFRYECKTIADGLNKTRHSNL